MVGLSGDTKLVFSVLLWDMEGFKVLCHEYILYEMLLSEREFNESESEVVMMMIDEEKDGL